MRSVFKLLLLILSVMLAPMAWGQAAVPISGQVVNLFGQPIPFAPIRICSVTSTGSPCTPTAAIYGDYTLANPSIPNPTAADQYGNYTVYAPALASPNLYVVQVFPSANVTWSYVRSGPSTGGGGGGGTVTLVGLQLPNWLTVTGTNPITSAGTFNVVPTTGEGAHQVIGTCGSTTTFAPCFLTAGDIPALPYLPSGTQLPVTINATAHQVLNSYTSGTGIFTSVQLSLGDIAAGASATGLYDFGGATQVRLPVRAGYTAVASGEIGYDSTNLNMHFNIASTDLLMLGFPSASGLPTNNDCAKFTIIGAWVEVTDAGAPCGSGSGSSVWSALTNPTTSLALTMGSNTTTFTFGATTGTADLMKWTDTVNNTGTGIMGHFGTAAGSTEIPWQADANGVGWQVRADGTFHSVGATVAGYIDFGAGPDPAAAPTSTIRMTAPTSVSAYKIDLPGAQPVGGSFMACTGANPAVCNWQGQLYTSQPTDTIASIEAQCPSSLCTYLVTIPQAFTLGANHTLSPSVQVAFTAGGLWTVSGAFALTLSNTVGGTLNPHFAGAATINGLSGAIPVEWFGAAGFTTRAAAGSGPDYCTNIQKTLNSVTGGGWAQIQFLSYQASCGLTITTSSVGIHGLGGRDNFGAPVSSIVSNSPDGIILSVTGSLLWNTFKDFSLERLVQPTGTGLDPTHSVGFLLTGAGGVTIDDVASDDSMPGFYFNGTPSFSTGQFSHLACANGFQGVNSYTGAMTINCYEIDSENNVPMNSATFIDDGAAVSGTAQSAATSTVFYVHGKHTNDIDIFTPGGSSQTVEMKFVYTGTGAIGTASDMKVHHPTFDSCGVSCVTVSGFPSGTGLTIDNGYFESNNASAKLVDIESSSGVAIRGNQFYMLGSGSIGLYANGSTSVLAGENTFTAAAATITGLQFNATTSSAANSNIFQPFTGVTLGTGMSFTGTSTGNSVKDNTVLGVATTGYAFDGTSAANDLASTCAVSGVATCVSGVPSATMAVYTNGNIVTPSGLFNFGTTPGGGDGTITTFGYMGPATAPSGSCSGPQTGTWVFSQDGHATFCNGTTWTVKI